MPNLDSSSLTPFPPELSLEKSVLILDSQQEEDAKLISQVTVRPVEPDAASNRIDYLPGYPNVGLEPSQVYRFLRRHLNTPVIDELYHVLWLFSVKCGRNIDPLHRQRIKGREIVPTEEAKLHLVWTKDRIYIKTMPICLLNHTIWNVFLGTAATQDWRTAVPFTTNLDEGFDRGVALGFLRSYSLLIQSPLDFAFAKEAHLFPEDLDIDWTSWAKFTAHFYGVQDGQVSKRYRFGQLRLNRLNWLLRVIQPKASKSIWFYQRRTWSVGAMIVESMPVLLFAFASLSLILSSMQVALATPAEDLLFAHLNNQNALSLQRTFWVFSVATIIISVLTWFYILLIPTGIFLIQMTWAIRTKGIANPNSRIMTSAFYEFAKV
jgi:hypothetical protein